MAEKLTPKTAQEFVGENNEIPSRDDLIDAFEKKLADLSEQVNQFEAQHQNGEKVYAPSERQLKQRLDQLTDAWEAFGGPAIDEAQHTVDSLGGSSEAGEYSFDEAQLDDAKDAFYDKFKATYGETDETPVDTEAAARSGLKIRSDAVRPGRKKGTKTKSPTQFDEFMARPAPESFDEMDEQDRLYLVNHVAEEIDRLRRLADDDSAIDEAERVVELRESLMRDGGISKEQAKAIVNEAYKLDEQSDADHDAFRQWQETGSSGRYDEADETAEKDSSADADMTDAKQMIAEGNIVGAEAIRKQLMAKARQSVESGRYNEADYEEALVALTAEMYDKSEAEIRELMKKRAQPEAMPEETAPPAEADSTTTEPEAVAAADASDDDIAARLDKYADRAVVPDDDQKELFAAVRNRHEADNAQERSPKSRLKRVLGRLSLHRLGVKGPGILSSIKQDGRYRRWLLDMDSKRRERKVARLDNQIEELQTRRQKVAGRERQAAKVDESSADQAEPAKELFGRELYRDNRKKIEHLFALAEQANQRGDATKAKQRYEQARAKLGQLEPTDGDNQAFSDVFDKDFYQRLDTLDKAVGESETA